MNRYFTFGLALGSLLGLASIRDARAISISLADLSIPSYGSAVHLDQSNEFLGMQGDAYDGVHWGAISPGSFFALTIDPTMGMSFGTGDYAYLSVWIDWDRSGTWGANEEVVDLDDYYFPLGRSPLTYQVAAPQLTSGSYWMRARFSFDGDLSPSGTVFTGEVEDYRLAVGTAPVPEPATVVMLLLGFAAVPWLSRRRMN